MILLSLDVKVTHRTFTLPANVPNPHVVLLKKEIKFIVPPLLPFDESDFKLVSNPLLDDF